MQGKVHVAIGAATAFMLCIKYPSGFEVAGMTLYPEAALFTVVAGSYAPDIDMGTTHSGRKHKVASKVISEVGGGHRGITHTLLVPVILFALMVFIWNYLAPFPYLASIVASLVFGLEVGWVMHIFADLFNGKGCPLLWPIVRQKISLMDLPSSGVVPWVFAVIYTGIAGYFFCGGLFG